MRPADASKPSTKPMRIRNRIIAAVFVLAASFGGASMASASACGPGIFEMADGRFYHLASGSSASSCVNLLNALGAAPAPASGTPAPSAPPSSAPNPCSRRASRS